MMMDEHWLTNLRDAHLHLAEHGAELSCLDLAECRSMAECLERIAQAAASGQGQRRGWILAVKARVEAWDEPVWPTAAQLRAAAGGMPTVVRSFDHHALIASADALRAAGIAPDEPAPSDPPGGVIERDKRTGRPTGLLLEKACALVDRVLPEPSRDERREHVRVAADDLASRGYVEAHDMLSRSWLGEILGELFDAGELPLRVRLHPTLEDLDEFLERRCELERDGIEIGGVKVFTDGTINSRTAWMLEPYAEPRLDSPRGVRLMSDDEIDEAIRRADSANLPIVAHAIGDAAVRAVLNAIERLGPKTPGARIEHAEFIDQRDVSRFAALGVIASVQPCHLLTDIEAIRRLLPNRAERVFPLRELLDSAGSDLVWFGTDAPVVAPSPTDNLQAAVHRHRADQAAEAAIAPQQAISPDEAIACMRA